MLGVLDAFAEGLRPNGMTSFGRSVAFLIGDDRLNKVNDLLLSGGRGVEFAAHLDESLVDMLLEGAEIRLECAEILLECAEVRSEVNEVLSDGIEACRCGLAELAEIVAESADVVVGGSCEYTSGRSVLLAYLYSPGQVTHLAFESGDT